MKQICLLFGLIFCTFNLFGGTRGTKPLPSPKTVKVLVLHEADRAQIEVSGRFRMFDPYEQSFLGNSAKGRKKEIVPLAGGIKWGEEFPGVYQMKIVGEENQPIAVNGKRYHGALYVYDVGGKISIINEVPIEEFVASILAEPGATLISDEAMAALAITARTDAYYQTAHPKNSFWHIDGREVAYTGIHPKAQHRRIGSILERTKRLVMQLDTGKNAGQMFPARWVDDLHAKESSSLPALHLDQAEEWGLTGMDASEILHQTFPYVKIQRLSAQK